MYIYGHWLTVTRHLLGIISLKNTIFSTFQQLELSSVLLGEFGWWGEEMLIVELIKIDWLACRKLCPWATLLLTDVCSLVACGA